MGDKVQEKINDVEVNYEYYDTSKKDTIVLLHGWGQNIEMMRPIADYMKKDFNILMIDLPGMGKSSEPTYAWTLYDYKECVHTLIEKLKIKNPILIGHSFGGKISIIYASEYKVKKLVLLASPFQIIMKKLTLKVKLLKLLKKVPILNKLEGFAKKHFGHKDYRNANPIMREIIVKHSNLEVIEHAKKITCETLLIWGSKDEAVKLEEGYYLNSLIKNSGIVVYENCTHYAYLERLGQTINVLYSFLGE